MFFSLEEYTTMATQTLTVATAGPDVGVPKTEVFDVDFADWILKSKDIGEDARKAVRRLYQKRVRGNQHETFYKLGKDLKCLENSGRLCAMRGTGLQCVPRDCRAALAQKYYWDVDMRNAQPTLLEQYATKRGWVCTALRRYNANRDDYIQEVMDSLDIERWEAKERVTALCFGGSPSGLPTFFSEELYPELRMLADNIRRAHPKEYAAVSKRPNPTASVMSLVLQTEERGCLLALDSSLASQGRSLEVYIHDGGLVRKKDGERRLPDELLRKAEADIEAATGYTVGLLVKELKTTLEREEVGEDDYQEQKAAFETTGWKRHIHFKLRFPPMFIAVSTEDNAEVNPVEQLTKGELAQNEEDHFLANGKPFLKQWLEDPDKREYDRLVFEPGLPDQPHNYNLFHGLPIQAEPGDWSVFSTLLTLLVNHDAEGYEYVENWMARRVQRLGEKSKVCLIFQGKKGVGKDTYWDQMGLLFGGNGAYFHNTSRPEHTVFARFNSQIAKCLLIKFEEADFQTNKANEEQLKGLITSLDSQIEKKGFPVIQVKNFTDVVMTTNQECPIPMSEDERRFAVFKVSEEKRGDAAFWSEVYGKLADGSALRAYYHHLLTKPLGDWSPVPAYKSRYYKDLVGVCAPIHSRFFCEWVQLRGEDETDVQEMGSSRELMRSMTQKFPKFPWDNHKKFGLMMRDCYVEGGPVMKSRSADGVSYRVAPKALKSFLELKGWWDE